MSLEKAKITNTVTGDIIEVKFNPEQYSIAKTNVFSEVGIPGLESPILQFCRGNTKTLTMDLFFDTYEKGIDVRILTEQVSDLQKIDPTTHAPPVCFFAWGTLTFVCVLESLTKKFEMFFSSGIPVRATLTVTFKEYQKPEEQALEYPEEPVNLTRTYQVVQGDTLWAISGREYGEPRKWRIIAEANNIDVPERLQIGIVLTIPPLRS